MAFDIVLLVWKLFFLYYEVRISNFEGYRPADANIV